MFTAQRILLLLTALCLSAFVPRSAAAQDYANVVWDQLQVALYDANLNGYALENFIIGQLSPGQSDQWTFPLEAGTEYLVVGACDQDCTDVDLTIRRGTERVVQDRLTDDVPIVRFEVGSSGPYLIELDMYRCSTSFCYFGFGLFERGS